MGDPLHDWSAPSHHWTTTNVRENVPGVPTPLLAVSSSANPAARG